uniref:Uncharacterized protein n=1 Tax=Manihot esculenta TaxID=3983 RepID=A0A2C9W1C2_MANES
MLGINKHHNYNYLGTSDVMDVFVAAAYRRRTKQADWTGCC